MTSGVAPRSLSEIRFYVTRAIVGAGAPFGIAEAAAEAIALMAAEGDCDWPAVANALEALGQGRSTAAPSGSEGVMSAFHAGPLLAWGMTVPSGDIDNAGLAQRIADCLRGGRAAGPPEGGVSPDEASWSVVTRWFGECLVPSSEESRLSGAGAGLVETD